MIVTEGGVADISCAHELVERLCTGAQIADKRYDSDTFESTIRVAHAKMVIPLHPNQKTERRYIRVLYRTRNMVERVFNRTKHFRRVSTQHDKLAGSHLAFTALACAFSR